jgi:hypothetical protein
MQQPWSTFVKREKTHVGSRFDWKKALWRHPWRWFVSVNGDWRRRKRQTKCIFPTKVIPTDILFTFSLKSWLCLIHQLPLPKHSHVYFFVAVLLKISNLLIVFRTWTHRNSQLRLMHKYILCTLNIFVFVFAFSIKNEPPSWADTINRLKFQQRICSTFIPQEYTYKIG